MVFKKDCNYGGWCRKCDVGAQNLSWIKKQEWDREHSHE